MARRSVPTVRDFLKKVAPSTKPSTRALYEPYWEKLVEGFPALDADGVPVPDAEPLYAFGDLPLDQVDELDLEAGKNLAMERAVRRRTSHTGQSAGEHYVGAARALFAPAVRKKLIAANPAADVTKPKRPKSTRSAIPGDLLLEVWDKAGTTGNDPRLDLLLLRFHLETGARRGGALALTRGDLDPARQTVWLSEKNGERREQPVTTKLLAAITGHMADRGVPQKNSAAVFRYRDGRPLSRRRYDTLFERLRREVPEAGQISAHWLRHTAITMVEYASSYSVAVAFAGHSNPRDVTGTYITITIADVADAVGRVWGEVHPLAPSKASPPSVAADDEPW